MYVRFDAPRNADGTEKVIAGRSGILLAHATVGPLSGLPDVELTSFGVWRKGATDGPVNVTVPSGTGGFAHLVGRAVKSTTEQEDENGHPVKIATVSPSIAGKKTLDAMCAAIAAAWMANPGLRLKVGERLELAPLGPVVDAAHPIAAKSDGTATAMVTAPKTTSK